MTLSQTATLTRRVIIIFLIALFGGTFSLIGYKIWYAYYLANLPPVEEKADTKFGLLPAPAFSTTSVSSSNFSYSIDTVTGGLPKVGVDSGFEKVIKVYFVTRTFASLLSPDRAQSLADKFGIKVSPKILSETNHFFEDNEKALNVDLNSGNFTYQRKIATPSGALEDDGKLISDFQRNLNNLGVLKQDLIGGRNKIIRLEDGGGQISIWPASINSKPIQTNQFNKSLINATVSQSAENLDNYISLNFIYYPIDTSTFATYPINSAEQALEDLKFGKGSVVLEPNKPQVSITSIYLAYFLAETYNPYLLPIFVFEGPQFAAYVPAVTEQFQAQTK